MNDFHRMTKVEGVAFVLALLVLLVLLAIGFQTAHAEEVQYAYTLDHPIEDGWLILATAQGRYQFERPADCAWVTSYVNVTVSSTDETVTIAPRDGGPSCPITVLGLIDTSPCIGYDVCDVTYELPEE